MVVQDTNKFRVSWPKPVPASTLSQKKVHYRVFASWRAEHRIWLSTCLYRCSCCCSWGSLVARYVFVAGDPREDGGDFPVVESLHTPASRLNASGLTGRCFTRSSRVPAAIWLYTRVPIQVNAVRSITRTTNQQPYQWTAIIGYTVNSDNLNTNQSKVLPSARILC